MEDIELYQHLLGLEAPWVVERVELSVKERRVDIWVGYPKGTRFPCPECQVEYSVYDHQERVWRHLDSCQFQTFVHARVPRVDCPTHGARQVIVPWDDDGSQFTKLFERLAIDLLRACSIQKAHEVLRITWDEAWGIMDRAVRRGRARKRPQPLRYIGIDEKSARKGHRYLTLVVNAESGQVEYIADDRKTESLDGFFQQLSPEQLAGLQGIALDIWEPYILSIREHVPDADCKMVFDRFHLMRHIQEAVDPFLRQEHRALLRQGASPLTGTKYLWLYAQENIPDHRREEFEHLRSLNLKVGRAWAIKESLRRLWAYISPGHALRFFQRAFWWATHSCLEPIRKVAHMFKPHLFNILTYTKHRLTNAVAEGFNNKIQQIKQMAYGFRNIEHFKIAIYFHCGGLDLYPH